MSHTRSSDQILDLESDTVAVIGKYLGYEYQTEPLPFVFRLLPSLSLGIQRDQGIEDEIRTLMLMGEHDVFKELGPISKEDYDYYENL
ncbi:MAG: hypothetical protein Q8Q46_01715 [Candidatus Giovannonibacteria bacterium]|nr:hypothetical protein [Candidatus Giovannonibacteria bacterium]